MKIEKFEDIISWQKSRILVNEIYKISKKEHVKNDFWFVNQIQRASVSIMSNIAEWFERQSNKELRQFLFIAKWSSGEVRCQLYIALDQNYISKEEFDYLYWISCEISKLLSSFIKTL